MLQKFEVERIVCGPRIFDGAYLIKWAGYPSSDNTWEPRSHLPNSVFEDDAGALSFPFEVVATETASANAATLVAHKFALTPKPFIADVSSESSDELASSKDEWFPGTANCLVDAEEDSGGETEVYPGNSSPHPTARFQITARSSATTLIDLFHHKLSNFVLSCFVSYILNCYHQNP
jgi:hypothetical protein